MEQSGAAGRAVDHNARALSELPAGIRRLLGCEMKGEIALPTAVFPSSFHCLFATRRCAIRKSTAVRRVRKNGGTMDFRKEWRIRRMTPIGRVIVWFVEAVHFYEIPTIRDDHLFFLDQKAAVSNGTNGAYF